MIEIGRGRRNIALVFLFVTSSSCKCTGSNRTGATTSRESAVPDQFEIVPTSLTVGMLVHTDAALDVSFEKRLDRTGDEEKPGVIVERWQRHARTKKDETIRATAEDGRVMAVHVAYGECSELLIREGDSSPYEIPISKHVYLVSAGPTGVTVKSTAGTPLTSEARAAIETDQAGLGMLNPWQVGLPTGILSVDASVPTLGPAIKGVLDRWASGGGGYTPTPLRIEIRVKGVRTNEHGRETVFGLTIKTDTPPKAPLAPEVDLEGELILRVPEGWPRELHVTGKVSKGARTMEGPRIEAGALDLTVSWSYEALRGESLGARTAVAVYRSFGPSPLSAADALNAFTNSAPKMTANA